MTVSALSAVIVTYSSGDTIIPCLEALTAAAPDAEVIIIDNHSPDTTADLVSGFKERDPGLNIRLIRSPRNIEYAAAVNLGLAAAQNPFLLLLGPDVYIDDQTLPVLYRHMEEHPRTGMASPALTAGDGSVTASIRKFPGFTDLRLELSGLPRLFPNRFSPAWKNREFDYSRSGPAEQPEASCLLCRREAVEEVGPMDERFSMFFNDVDWCRRFLKKGWNIQFCHNARAVHVRGVSVYGNRLRMIWRSHQGFYRYLKKHHAQSASPAVIAAAGLCLLLAAVLRASLWQSAHSLKKCL